ncbi:putative Fe-containing alcohol dehydrogenase [Mycena latifolia]|nr:putative Fe-containing alcohol dehydrogenase [Mycena latifolia]
MVAQETFRPAVPPYDGPLPKSLSHNFEPLNYCNISYGAPFHEACAKHAEDTFHAERVFIIASRTLAESTSALTDLKAALGAKLVGVKVGLKAHTYLDESIAMAEECRAFEADLIVTLGGGSLSDAAKMVSLALANDVKHSAGFLELPTTNTIGTLPPAKPPTVPVVCIATTLSGGEFTVIAGATDERDDQKHQFIAGKAIQLVILDAQLVTETTPLSLFLQSGVRAIDHCVEAICSPLCNAATEMHASKALAQLVPALLRCKTDDAKTDVEARHLCQMAGVEAMASFRVLTPCGASHAIGHMLGPFGVGHGHTSAILLPAVCKFNLHHGDSATLSRQKIVTSILWRVPEMRRLAESAGSAEGSAGLGDLLDLVMRALGMPRTLAEVGVGRDRFEKLAEYSLFDTFSATNPVPLTERGQVMEILEMVAGGSG